MASGGSNRLIGCKEVALPQLAEVQAELVQRWEAEDARHNAEVAKIRAEFQQKVRALQAGP